MNTVAMTANPADIANQAMEAVTSHAGDVVIDAPPGAGKTSLLLDLVGLTTLVHRRRVLVAAVSNDQCDDITLRLAADFPRLNIDRFLASGATRPALRGIRNITMTDSVTGLGSPVIVANIEKFGQVESVGFIADHLFIDEAYQARRADYDRVRALAERACQIGDPGQIRPIHQADIRLYAGDNRGPHVASPVVLLKEGNAVHLQMRRSRRLPQDTIEVVQPAFYPQLQFTAVAAAGGRAITGSLGGTTPLDRRLDDALRRGSLSMLALPSKEVPRLDREVIDTVINLVNRVIRRQLQFRDDARNGTITATEVGVVAFHRDQVAAIRQGVPAGVYVETANRFQGLERRFIVALHPMSGAMRLTDFRAEAGRACVALSRHRVACIMVGRDGILDLLDRAVPEDERFLGRPDDPVFEGLRAHRTLLELLEQRNAVIRL